MSDTHAGRVLDKRRKDFLIPAHYAMRFREMGSLIRELRERKGISLNHIDNLEIHGLDKYRLSKIENDHQPVSRDTLGKLMPTLGCPKDSDPIEWFFTELQRLNIESSPSKLGLT